MLGFIDQEYGLKAEQIEKLGHYDTFVCQNERYIIVPARHRTEVELNELYQMGLYLAAKGNLSVATIVPTKKGKMMADGNGQPFAVFRIYPQLYTRTVPIGKELAKLHAHGRLFPAPVVHCKRIGQWKELWGHRLDQMELFWKEKVQTKRKEEFDNLFIESFPYYAGLTENAIQYVADTELDEQPYVVDAATICHERLPQALWVEGKEIKLPTDWVYDHCARDLAEWVRALYMRNGAAADEQMRRFFREYERVTPLSAFSWRLIYARLLFPLHYFECVEGYYLTESEQEKQTYAQMLRSLVTHSREYESFLVSFYERLELAKRFQLPIIRWLSYA